MPAPSMRDIAAAVGMLPGSLYYHFASKDVLVEEIFIAGTAVLSAAIEAAIAGLDDPWARLERACITHLAAHLSESAFATVIASESLKSPPALRARLSAIATATRRSSSNWSRRSICRPISTARSTG